MDNMQQKNAQDLEIALQQIEDATKRLEELKHEANELIQQARKVQAAHIENNLQA